MRLGYSRSTCHRAHFILLLSFLFSFIWIFHYWVSFLIILNLILIFPLLIIINIIEFFESIFSQVADSIIISVLNIKLLSASQFSPLLSIRALRTARLADLALRIRQSHWVLSSACLTQQIRGFWGFVWTSERPAHSGSLRPLLVLA